MTAGQHAEPPVWFDISSHDAPRARRFYREMFDWPIREIDGGYALVGEDDGPVGGIGQAGPGSPYTGITVYFRVADVDSALARAERLGGTPVLEPVDVPGQGRIAAFSDPDGHVVGLSSG
ncbi:VOC family protein [Actinoalloteichus sp. AHMU CJ021]|uniref:VOC domain-containing protein n=2 Tax=Actinoalloteichus cyanogriseus TaxID=2893586 RepID=A0ABT1JBA0_ACTCY|nr:VOC family protein [Actinoalloteichus caeruleus]AUS79468.1 VOC family protein [Actinoalloteichus sp. AHMU CJ021]MCP2329780.1 hypothetical protein [Actinoalloteichus caeruleus DSM 43889]